MSEVTRGEFLGIGAALAGGFAFGCAPGNGPEARAQATGSADLVVMDARVITVDDEQPAAEAFAVKDGRFMAVGSSADIRNLVAAGTEVVDAGGMTVTPGFIDAHSHPAGAGVNELVHVNVDLRSVEAIQEALAARARETPPGEWVIGFKYDDTKLAEGRPVNRRDLDQVSTRHPVVVRHRGGHTAVYNSMAFELAGVTVETPDPPGGAFYRESGELTGKVAERARAAWDGLIPSGSTREQRQAGVALISELMTAAGLTTVHHTGCSPDDMVAYQDALGAGELRFRTYAFPRGSTYRSLAQAGIRTGFGNDWLRIGAVKFAADGSASERTMAMSTPYVGRPDDFGILTMSQDEIHEVVEEAHRDGWQIGIHANGDVAIDMVLNAYERVQELWPRPDPRHRIEHCSLVNDDLLRRIKAAGVVPAPFYTYVHYHGNKWVDYGEEEMRSMFAHRSFLDHDIPVAPASDYTPGPFEPLMAIQSMVTRKDFEGRVWGENQRVTVDEALRICTLNGAHASFEESLKGSITAGKLADFVVLAQDPHAVDPDAIKDIEVARTVVGGKTMHQA
jgi:predicted amidohydrolase YtcJ